MCLLNFLNNFTLFNFLSYQFVMHEKVFAIQITVLFNIKHETNVILFVLGGCLDWFEDLKKLMNIKLKLFN